MSAFDPKRTLAAAGTPLLGCGGGNRMASLFAESMGSATTLETRYICSQGSPRRVHNEATEPIMLLRCRRWSRGNRHTFRSCGGAHGLQGRGKPRPRED